MSAKLCIHDRDTFCRQSRIGAAPGSPYVQSCDWLPLACWLPAARVRGCVRHMAQTGSNHSHRPAPGREQSRGVGTAKGLHNHAPGGVRLGSATILYSLFLWTARVYIILKPPVTTLHSHTVRSRRGTRALTDRSECSQLASVGARRGPRRPPGLLEPWPRQLDRKLDSNSTVTRQ